MGSPRAGAALTALSAAAFCYVTIELLPIGLLTLISADLHRSPAQTGLLVTGYAVVVMVASLPLTRLTRRVPRRWLLAGTLAVFTATIVVSALSRSYEVLLGARLVTALTQGVFWSVAFPTAIGMFAPEIHGRVVARMSVGNALAPVLGIPAATWLGQQAGWRVSFAVMGVISLAICLAVTVLVPDMPPEEADAARGSHPDRHRYTVLLVVTVLGVTGAMGAFTYMTAYLLDVSGFAASSLSGLLLIQGACGVAGTLLIGRHLDRFPRATVVALLVLITMAFLGLFAFGPVQVPTVVFLAVAGLSYSSLAAAIQHRAMQTAPGRTDLASAGLSAAFNCGIAVGSLGGAGLLSAAGLRPVPLAAGVFTAVALVMLLLGERHGAPRGVLTPHRQRRREKTVAHS